MKKFNNIFIVDDDLVYHFIIKKLFSKCNIDVNVNYFFNGLDAINDLKKRKNSEENIPDLILLDINMPICDGWQFLDEFKKIKQYLKKEVTVFLVSSSNDVSDINKSILYKDDVKKYFYKPMTKESFETIFI